MVHEHKHATWEDTYVKVRELGRGMTGSVFLIRQKETGDEYALKCMETSRVDPELLADLHNEMALLKMLDHPNVVRLLEVYETKTNVFLVLELCSGGELFDRLHEQVGSKFSERDAARLVFKMTAALAYIVSAGCGGVRGCPFAGSPPPCRGEFHPPSLTHPPSHPPALYGHLTPRFEAGELGV